MSEGFAFLLFGAVDVVVVAVVAVVVVVSFLFPECWLGGYLIFSLSLFLPLMLLLCR